MHHQILSVNLHPPYPLHLGHGLLPHPERWLTPIAGGPVVIVTSPTVAQHHLATLQRGLDKRPTTVFTVADGEPAKTLATWQQLLLELAEHRVPRDATLITLGGGTLGDLGGFAAACYQRGIAWIQCPTTLLAQVDASIGGKVGVNLPAGKNLVGNFYQPKAVVIDVATLSTLPQREYRAGLAEVVKAALIYDAAFFEWIEQHVTALVNRDPSTLLNMIARACTIKATLVAQDEREHHARALLNLGHTFGHALEHLTGYTHYLHGEAVAIGLVLATHLSHRLLDLPVTAITRVQQLLTRLGLPTQLPPTLDPQALLASMRMDKKIRQQRLRFIVLERLGHAVITDQVNEADVLQCLLDALRCSLTHPECFSSVETPCTSQD